MAARKGATRPLLRCPNSRGSSRWKSQHSPTPAVAGSHGRSPLLRLQSDERLIALVRRGNHGAFEELVRPLPGAPARRSAATCSAPARTPRTCCRRSSRRPSTRSSPTTAPINVRPWLYRIARNRSLNHLRRVQAIGVDSMDVHLVRARRDDRRQGRQPRGVPRADHRRRRPAGDAAHGAAAARDRRALLRADRRGDGDDDPERQVAAGARPRVARRGRRGAPALLRGGAHRAGRDRRGPAPPHDARRCAATCARASAARRSAPSCARSSKALAMLLPVGPLLLAKKLFSRTSASRRRRRGRRRPPAAPRSARRPAPPRVGDVDRRACSPPASARVATKAAVGLAAAALVTAGAVEIEHRTPHRAQPQAQQVVAQAPVARRTAGVAHERARAADRARAREAPTPPRPRQVAEARPTRPRACRRPRPSRRAAPVVADPGRMQTESSTTLAARRAAGGAPGAADVDARSRLSRHRADDGCCRTASTRRRPRTTTPTPPASTRRDDAAAGRRPAARVVDPVPPVLRAEPHESDDTASTGTGSALRPAVRRTIDRRQVQGRPEAASPG